MAEKTYEQGMQSLREELPQGGTQAPEKDWGKHGVDWIWEGEEWPVQEGVDPDVDIDDEPGLADLDIEPIVDVPTTSQAALDAAKQRRQGGGSSVTVPGRTTSGQGGVYGGSTTAGTSSGGKGGELPPTRGTPKNLEEYENRMIAEYRDVGEKVVGDAHGEDAATDFLHDEGAQRDFAEKAALQSFNEMDAAAEGYAAESRTIGGAEVEVFVFDDGSEYYVDPKANPNDLQPGDVIRIELPASAR